MKPNDHQHSGQFEASLPLPDELKIDHAAGPPPRSDSDAAANLVRQKIEAVYADAPPAAAEVEEVSHIGKSAPISKHQQFVDELINSGKSLPEIQTAWNDYYAGLTDYEKHGVWQEFYDRHNEASVFNKLSAQPEEVQAAAIHRSKPRDYSKTLAARKAAALRHRVASGRTRAAAHGRKAAPLRSLLFGLSVGALVIVIFLFGFFNERFIAPFIQPSRTITSTPIITSSTTVGSSPEIIIPKINVEIPVVYGVDTISDTAVENALEDGVVHYADTALPGQDGNVVIVGHSSNNIFNPGKYKFAFVLLSRLDSGDTFYLQKDGVRYTYQVYQKEIVNPTDVSVLGTKDKPATATLITCDPPGTSINRLVVIGQQISPDPAANAASTTSNNLATKSAIIPGNSPSLWSRLFGWL